MKKLFFFLIFLCIGLYSCEKKDVPTVPATATAVVTTPEAVKGSLSGTVSPVTAVTGITLHLVTATGAGTTYSAIANAQGYFSFADLPQGAYMLTFNVTTGYQSISRSATVVGGRNTDIENTFIPIMPGSISGVITPAGAAKLISITSKSGGTYYGTVTGTGNFQFSSVAPGEYTLSFTATPGYTAPVIPVVTVTTAQNTNVGTLAFKVATPGSISGSVSPAGSVDYVWAIYNGSTVLRYTVVPDASGKFRMSNVTPGTYEIAAIPTTGSNLYAPYDRRFTVTDGQDTFIGNIGLTPTPPPYPFSCAVDGTDGYSTRLGAVYSPAMQTLSISTTINGNLVSIYADGVTGTGDYTCNSTTKSLIRYTVPPKGSGIPEDNLKPYTIWSTQAGGNGTIKITAIDEVNKTVSGNFSGLLGPSSSNAKGMKTITKGTFVNVQYQ